MNTRHGDIWPEFDYHLTWNKLQESKCERDFGADILPCFLPGNHIRRVVDEVNYMLVTVKIAFRYKDKGLFRKIFTAYMGPKLEYTSPVWSLHI